MLLLVFLQLPTHFAVGGTVSIGGTLTYEDVTNVDAVGLITAKKWYCSW